MRKLRLRQPPVTVRVDLLELVPEAVEVRHVLQQQPELLAPHEAVAAHVRRLVRAHQRGLVVELGPQLQHGLVDLGQRERAVAVVVHAAEECVALLLGRQRQLRMWLRHNGRVCCRSLVLFLFFRFNCRAARHPGAELIEAHAAVAVRVHASEHFRRLAATQLQPQCAATIVELVQ